MLVVSDTSPISALIQIGRVELLRDLFTRVCVPPEVNAELGRFHPSLPPFIEVRDVMDRARVQSLVPRVDLGEAEAIVLAIETQADHLLIDERRGRLIAAQAGVPIIGLIGVLLLAKNRGLLPAVKDAIDDLRMKAGFYLADYLVQQALQAAGE
jgi:uncharacterized protein